MGALCVCVCISGERGQDMERENTRGPTADSSCQTSCFIQGWGACLPEAGWEEADERMKTPEYCRPQKHREPHQPLEDNT